MKLQYKSRNLEIYGSQPLDEFSINSFRIGFNKNKKLFEKSPKKVKATVCNTEEEFKKASKYYYFPHGVGTCLRNGTLVLRSFKFLKRPKKHYRNLIIHEMNHSFWILFFKDFNPCWLSEAFATLVEGRLNYDFHNLKNTKKLIINKKLNESCLKYRYIYKDFKSKKQVKLYYSIWTHFLIFISRNDKKKIMIFLKEHYKKPSRKNYEKLFRKHFGDFIKNKFKEFSSG